MKSRLAIDIACNDPDNGLFAGRAGIIMIGDDYIELESDNCHERSYNGGYRFTELPDGSIRLHRRRFEVVSSKELFGNWCWNRYWLDRTEAKRFILTLRESGRWRCTCGPMPWYAWFNREGRFAPKAAAA